MLLHIVHRTEYFYSTPVAFGPHRLLIRPREGHDVQIRSSALRVRPKYRLRWVHDAFENSVALVDFDGPSDHLMFESEVVVEQYNSNPLDFILDHQAQTIPFEYGQHEKPDLHHFMQLCHPHDEGGVRNWIRPFLDTRGRAATVDCLMALNRSVPLFFQYARREEAGVQTPGETLRYRSGSCRDFALLFMEAARCLGLAARFVTGYLCANASSPLGQATGATHAWTEVYLPGAGWKGFDPTGGVLAADLHVRAGVARLPSQAAPVSGSFAGPREACVGMNVVVKVELTTQHTFS
jgi:transglutaminase-like putative cysteine protease